MAFRWQLRPTRPELEEGISRSLRVSRLLARLLAARGADTPEAAHRFLSAELTDLEDPELIPGMTAAVERIAEAVRRRERILVFGDYDVDGLAATALLSRLLSRLVTKSVGGRPSPDEPSWRPSCYIPHRIDEGYGLNRRALEEIAASDVQLVITVDCGMDAFLYEDVLREAPFDLVIVDHHEPGEPIPFARAVANPKLAGGEAGFSDLAGVGVVFKLAVALVRRLYPDGRAQGELDQLFTELLALTALGTVADVVPLLGENRILARLGLVALQHSELPGLRALLETAGVGGRKLDARAIGFRLGPRLNAAGRMAEASAALELLTTESPPRAREIAASLEVHNRNRRRLQEEIQRQALQKLSGDGLLDERVLVVGGEDWSPGVIGIVAGRLSSRFHRPAAVVAFQGDTARGSARSIPGFHIHQALRQCSECLLEFGGHARAAGFSLQRHRIDELRRRLNDLARGLPEELWEPTLAVDAEVLLFSLNTQAIKELERLEPLGEQNPPPVLISHDVRVAGDIRRLGSSGRHLSFYARQGNAVLRVIGFDLGDRADELARLRGACSIAYTPKLSTFNSPEPVVELELLDFHPPGQGG